MSLVEETGLAEPEAGRPDDHEDRSMNVLQPGPTPRSSISPLSLFKEDFSQFKEDLLKVFKDKDTRPEPQADGNLVSSTLGLLRDDLSQFKEDISNVFSSSRETKSTDKTLGRRSLRDVFRIGPSKERDANEDSSDTSRRTDEPLRSLIRRDQNRANGPKSNSETTEEPKDEGLQGHRPEETQKNINAEKNDHTEERELDLNTKETQSHEETSPSQTAEQSEAEEWSDDSSVASADQEQEEQEEEEEEQEEEQEQEEDTTLPWPSLSSAISLLSLSDPNKDGRRSRPGDEPWAVKNFACYLTFDPNTANSELLLTDCNRRATRVWSDLRLADHPDRFQLCPQVLCREGLLDSVYWEVAWSGGADVGVAYNNISRDGDPAACLLGHNRRSWSLECSEGSYTPSHANRRFSSSSPRPFSRRVGVHLDWSAGSLSFYCVSPDAMVHLHTFSCRFTEPLYPAFWVWAYDGAVSLCQVQLDWERLLQ